MSYEIKQTEDWQTAYRNFKERGNFDDKFEVDNLAFIYAFQMGFKEATASTVKPVEREKEQFFIRQFDSNKYYWCKCENCGWEDSSEFTEGCHAIADTGDHSDPVCPICFGNKLEGDSAIDPNKEYEGVVEVKIPYDIIISAYKKTIDQLNESLENFRYPSPVNPSLQSGVEEEGYDILKELKKLDDILDGDGFKSWCYVRLALSEATKAISEKLQAKQVKQPVMQLDLNTITFDFAKKLQQRCMEALQGSDAYDLLEIQDNHNAAFESWCKENKHAGHDDQMESDFAFLGKAIQFFLERGYIK